MGLEAFKTPARPASGRDQSSHSLRATRSALPLTGDLRPLMIESNAASWLAQRLSEWRYSGSSSDLAARGHAISLQAARLDMDRPCL